MTAWLRYLIAFVVGCHGFTHVPFGLLVPDRVARALEAARRRRLGGPTQHAGSSAASGGGSRHSQLRSRYRGRSVGPRMVASAGHRRRSHWSGCLRGLLRRTGSTAGVEGAIGAVASLILLVTAIAIPEAFR